LTDASVSFLSQSGLQKTYPVTMLLLSSMALLLVGAAMVRAAGQVNTHAMNMYKHPFNGDVRTT